jgi:hypothetical protein
MSKELTVERARFLVRLAAETGAGNRNPGLRPAGMSQNLV